MGEVFPVPLYVVLVAVLISAVTDVWSLKVYNRLTFPLLLSGLAYHGAVHGLTGLAESGLGALFGFGVLITFYLAGGMGAGDVKLLAAVGAWLGIPLTIYVFLASSLAAGVYAIVLVILHRRFGEAWINLQIVWYRLAAIGRHLGADERVESAAKRGDRARVIPFGAMIALGTLTITVWLLVK